MTSALSGLSGLSGLIFSDPAILFDTDFHGPNSTTAFPAPQVTTNGATWSVIGGGTSVYGTLSNQGYLVSTGDYSPNSIDIGQSSCRITVIVGSVGSNWLSCRLPNKSTWVNVVVGASSIKIDANESGHIGESGLSGSPTASVTVVAGNTIDIYLVGNFIAVHLNGTRVLTTTNSSFATKTIHGLCAFGANEKWNKYTIRRLTATDRAIPLIVFDGDSLTAGSGSTIGHDYPKVVMNGLTTLTYEWYNLGKPGDNSAQIQARFAANAAPQPNFYRPRSAYVLEASVNDFNGGLTPAQSYSANLSILSLATAAGYGDLFLNTACPTGTAGDAFQTWRTTKNGLITGGAAANGYTAIDIASDATIGQDGQATNLTYYQSDQTHMTDAGYAIKAGYVKTALNAKGYN